MYIHTNAYLSQKHMKNATQEFTVSQGTDAHICKHLHAHTHTHTHTRTHHIGKERTVCTHLLACGIYMCVCRSGSANTKPLVLRLALFYVSAKKKKKKTEEEEDEQARKKRKWRGGLTPFRYFIKREREARRGNGANTEKRWWEVKYLLNVFVQRAVLWNTWISSLKEWKVHRNTSLTSCSEWIQWMLSDVEVAARIH